MAAGAPKRGVALVRLQFRCGSQLLRADGATPVRLGARLTLSHRHTQPKRFPVPWQERVLSATIHVPHGAVEVTTTHVPPGSSNGWIKIEHLEGLRLGLAAGCSKPRLLCGDFNTPRREVPTGEVITFGQTEAGRLNRARGARWDAAERGILLGR